VFLETVPIFINVRDRLSCLQQLLEWLKRAGHRNVTLIDNASTYPPLVKFLDQTDCRIIRLKQNLGHTALWRIRELRRIISGQWFVYTDPDVVPSDTCPLNVVALMHRLLQIYPCYLKAGLGLRLDDIPDCYHLKQSVISWEQHLIGKEIAPDVFEADVDTTFALYRSGMPYLSGPAVRFQGRYSARHLAWYTDSFQPDEEEQYYRSHASLVVTTWNVDGDNPHQSPTIPGGIAAQIENTPNEYLKKLLRTKTGRTTALLIALRQLSRGRWQGSLREESLSPEQARQTIFAILKSSDWHLGWRLVDPFRRIKSPLKSILRRWHSRLRL